MKSRLTALVVILSFGLEGCSTTYVLTKNPQPTLYFQTQYMSYEELMAKSDGKIVTIVMRNGDQERGKLTCAGPDSIAWADFKTGAFYKVPTSQVHHLNLYGNFAWEGGAIGLLLCTVPLLAGGAWGPQYPSRLDEPDYSWRTVIVIGGLFGGAAGFGIGTQIKATEEFQVVSLAGRDTTKSDSTR